MKTRTHVFGIVLSIVAVSLFLEVDETFGQQIGVTTPFTSISESYYENHGVDFGFTLPGGRGPGSRVVGWGPGGFSRNLNFRQGGAASAIPAFGGYDPNASARFGFGRIGRNGGGFGIGLTMGKGSSRTMTTTAPSITVPNGFGGVIQSGAFSPFVTGYYPVVGGQPVMDNAVTRAVNSGLLNLTDLGDSESKVYPSTPATFVAESSAQHGDASVASIKARRLQMERQLSTRFERLVSEGLAMEEKGQFREARTHYRKSLLEFKDRERKDWFRERVRFIRDR